MQDAGYMQLKDDFPFSLISHEFYGFQLLIPDQDSIREIYQQGAMAFPYWSKIWASAVALSEWIEAEPQLVKGLDVMEIGGGIGLPSFVTSQYARNILITDHQQYAVELLKINIALNKKYSINTRLLDWRFDEIPPAHIYLLSDVNYEPESMNALQNMITKIIKSGAQICLATPQRITAIAFVEFIQPLILSSHIRSIEGTKISLYHLAAASNA